MKLFRTQLAACFVFLAVATSAQGETPQSAALGRVYFVDGKSIQGHLQSFSPQTGLVWQDPQRHEPLTFKAASLKRIVFDGPKAKTDESAMVWLTNGDVLPGRLVSFDQDHLVLETSCAGRLTIKRPFVRMLSFQPNAPSLHGFGKPGDWQIKDSGRSDGMRVLPNKMEFTGYVWASTQVPLGDQFCLEVTGDTTQHQLQFSFCLDRPLDQQEPPAGYRLTLQEDAVLVDAYNGGNIRTLACFRVQMPDGYLRTTVTGNAADKTLTVAVNGKHLGVIHLKKWTNGKFMALGSNGGKTVFTQLDVTASLPAVPLPSMPVKDVLRFANQDHIQGQLLWVKDGQAAIKTLEEDLVLPIIRLAQVDFALQGEPKVQAATSNEVQIFFDAHARMTLKVDSITGNQLVGHSEILGGECKVNLAAVKKLRFK